MTTQRLVTLLLTTLLALPAWSEDTVHLGFLFSQTPEMSRSDIRTSFDLWVTELATQFRIPVTVNFYDDADTLAREFRQGRINGVTAEAMTFIRHFKQDELAEGYSVIRSGGWDLLLMARKGSGISHPRDLIGMRVARMQGDPVLEHFLEILCLRHHQRPCAETFSEILTVPNENQALMRLYFGQADLALVHRYGYELAIDMNPKMAQKIGGVVAELPLKTQYFAFYSAKVDKTFRQRTLRVVPTLHQYPRGRQLMYLLKMDHLELADPKELKPFQQLDQELRELKTRYERGGGRK